MTDRVSVASFTYAHEAALAVTTLRGMGLDAQLLDQHTVGTDPLLSNVVGGVKVQVPPEEVEQARELLTRRDETSVVFRERIRGGIGRSLVGGFIAFAVGISLTRYLPGPVVGALVIAAVLLLVISAPSETRCSLPSCHARLDDEERCPRCQGRVAGDLRPGENHLAAQERLAPPDSG